MGVFHWVLLVFVLTGSTSGIPATETTPQPDQEKPKLLYIMMDGFRWDYIELHKDANLPTFKKIFKEGVRVRWTNPIFPPNSYPSWITLVTGLYPESHNILDNFFYDISSKEVFSLTDSETQTKEKWWTSEPIWTTAEKSKLKTAQFKWARCDMPFQNTVTHHCEPYREEDYHNYNFLKQALNGLKKFDEGYDFVQVYTVDPDIHGHRYGPKAPEVGEKLEELDRDLAEILNKLKDRNLTDKVNIVIASDHGMMDSSAEAMQIIQVGDSIDDSLVEKVTQRTGSLYFYVTEQNIQQVYDQLSKVPHTTIYKNEDIPEELHFKGGKYAPQILMVPSEGYKLVGLDSEKQLPRGVSMSKGQHGFNITLEDMRGIFFAKGPAFRKGLTAEPIDLVDIYQVLTTVLEITPRPHNGTWSHVEAIFEPSFLGHVENQPSRASALTVIPLAVMIVLATLAVWLSNRGSQTGAYGQLEESEELTSK